MNKKQFRSFDEAQVEFYKKHPEKLKGHISVALSEYQKDGDEKAFLSALSMAATVHGGFSKVAKSTGLNRAHLYKALSRDGDPRLSTIMQVMGTLGLSLKVI
ncbi:MAG: addiction module antidote protein [Candidatus Omnitrophota bacterium]